MSLGTPQNSEPHATSGDAACIGSSEREELYFGIEITRRCNLRCPHCFTASGGAAPDGPSLEAAASLLTSVAAAGIRSVAFSGGEPLLRKDLPELVAHGRRMGIDHFGVVTNGFVVDRASARTLVEAGLRSVQISVDGVDAADHAAVRACEPRDYYRALRAARIFLDLGAVVDIATILSPRNLRRAPEMAMLCEALGVRGLRYCTFVPAGRARSDEAIAAYRLEPAEVDRFLTLMRALNRQRDARLQIFIDHGIGPWLESGAFQCVAGDKVAYVSAEGDLYPCPSLIFDEFKIGNVFASPLSELLASPRMAAVRSMERATLQGPCAACPSAACSGGCRGAAYARTGSARGAVAYCGERRRLGGDGARSRDP